VGSRSGRNRDAAVNWAGAEGWKPRLKDAEYFYAPRPPPHCRGVPPPAARRLHPLCRSAGAHQFDAAGQRGHLFQDPLCALRIVMPWRPEWIAGTKGGGTISSTWWVWTAEPRPSASPGTCGSSGGCVRAPEPDSDYNRACPSALGQMANGRAEKPSASRRLSSDEKATAPKSMQTAPNSGDGVSPELTHAERTATRRASV
jgi:hypothetical protein